MRPGLEEGIYRAWDLYSTSSTSTKAEDEVNVIRTRCRGNKKMVEKISASHNPNDLEQLEAATYRAPLLIASSSIW